MNMHRVTALVTLLALAACSTGPAYEIRPSATITPTASQDQAVAECRVEVMKATAGIQNYGVAFATGDAMWNACLLAKGYDRVPVGS